MGCTVRHVLRALDCWRAPQDAAQDLRLAGCIMERLGKLKSFCEQSLQLPLCGCSPSPRHRSNQQRPFGRGRHAGKGKNKSKKGLNQGRGQQQEPASPFQTGEQGFASWHSLDASKFMPTSELAPSPSASVATAFSSADQEWVQPL